MGALEYTGSEDGSRFNNRNIRFGTFEDGLSHAQTVIAKGLMDPKMSAKLMDFQSRVLPAADKIFISNIRMEESLKQDIVSRIPDARPADHIILEAINGYSTFLSIDMETNSELLKTAVDPRTAKAVVFEYKKNTIEITRAGLSKVVACRECDQVSAFRERLLKSGIIAQAYKYSR